MIFFTSTFDWAYNYIILRDFFMENIFARANYNATIPKDVNM